MKLSNVANIRLDNSLVEGRGRHFVSRFIEPGLVSYDKAGVLKVSKETLDKFVQSLVGCPVIIRHQKVSNDNVEDLRCGVVSGVNYNTADGWFWCEGIIWDAEAIQKIEQGWSVSCTYIMTESTGEDGEWHNMSYDDELLNGVFEHLAIVPNPRYEEATILLNSKEDKGNMLLNLFNSKKIRNSDEEGKDMKKENEESIDKNALKNRIMEHVNKAVKGQGEIDGQSEDSWYEEFRKMLDKLAYSESEDEKSNEKEDEETKDKEEEKENSCKSNESDEDKEDKEEEDEKENEDEEEKDEEDEDDRKSNSKGGDFEKMKRLSNSGSADVASGYMSETARIELGNKLY